MKVTLYPLLRRPGVPKASSSANGREEDKRNKRFYLLSADGKAMLKQLLRRMEKPSILSLNGIIRR